MKIMFNDLSKQWELIKNDVMRKFDTLFEKSNFIGGQPIEEFEKIFVSK